MLQLLLQEVLLRVRTCNPMMIQHDRCNRSTLCALLHAFFCKESILAFAVFHRNYGCDEARSWPAGRCDGGSCASICVRKDCMTGDGETVLFTDTRNLEFCQFFSQNRRTRGKCDVRRGVTTCKVFTLPRRSRGDRHLACAKSPVKKKQRISALPIVPPHGR